MKQVILHTSQGDIRILNSSLNSLLARLKILSHAKEGYTITVLFHRVIDGFMVQTGDPQKGTVQVQSIWHDMDKTKDKGTGFMNEITPYLCIIRWVLLLANTGQPNTNGSQFFFKTKTIEIPLLIPLQASIHRKLLKPTKNGNPLV